MTGFGLIGHLIEMLTASGPPGATLDARLDPEAIPALDGALALLAGGLTSSLHSANLSALASLAPGGAACDPALAALLIDPQTAGGLLAGVPSERAAACLAELCRLGYRAADDRDGRRGQRRPAACPARSGLRANAGNAGTGGGHLMRERTRDRRAALPAVDLVLRAPGATALIERHGRSLVLDAVRDVLAECRNAGEPASVEAIVAASGDALARLMQPSQRRVFNLTGTVLHTNLGRAPLPEEAVTAAVEAMREPSTLEYDLQSGRRGERDDHVAGLADAADRRRGRARGQQQRRRAAPRAERARRGA